MAAMAPSALIPSINPVHSFRHHFPQSTSSFILPNFLRIWRCGISGGNLRCGITMAVGKDHYSTLKVNRDATLQEIRSAYRKLARKYHPDMNKNPGAEDKFKEISAAYERERKLVEQYSSLRRSNSSTETRQEEHSFGAEPRKGPSLWHKMKNFRRPEDSKTKFGTMTLVNSSLPLGIMKEAETTVFVSVLAMCVITSAVALFQKTGNCLKQKKL